MEINVTETFPKPEVFLAERPLYSLETFDGEEVWKAVDLIYIDGTYDGFCTKCGPEATFKVTAPERPNGFTRNLKTEALYRQRGSQPPLPNITVDAYRIRATCTREATHRQDFFFLVDFRLGQTEEGKTKLERFIQKVGQHPSFGDLHLEAVKKYRGSLPAQQLRELSQAIGLASHDVGIGSYVYLRRVFEWLVEEAHLEAAKRTDWNEQAYIKLRMAERIAALRHSLPDFLVEHPEMYSLLSKGVHELTENECLEHFSTLRIAIELILDERHEKKLRERKIAQAKSALAKATSKDA
jgi:hypothetical protein